MRTFEAYVSEIQLSRQGAAAWIACPAATFPAAGQYCLAWSQDDENAPLAAPLFPVQFSNEGFLAAPPVPLSWEPGSRLLVRGPLGRPFSLPPDARRLALAALGDCVERMLPLLSIALAQDMAVALFADCAMPPLPAAVEVYPLVSLPENLAWADFLALDLPARALHTLRQALELRDSDRLPCAAQALLLETMPCGGLAGCGACAVRAHTGWKLACVDGPVFDLNDLEW